MSPKKSIPDEIANNQDYYSDGNKAYEDGEYEKAIEYYSKSLELGRNCLECYFNRALAKYVLAGKGPGQWRYEDAIKDFDCALAEDPDNPLVFNNRGDCYYRLREFQRAIEDYDKAVELHETYFKALYNRGLARACLEDYPKARDDFSQAIRVAVEEDDRAVAYNARGLARQYADDLKGAIGDFSRARHRDESAHEPLARMADALADLSREGKNKERIVRAALRLNRRAIQLARDQQVETPDYWLARARLHGRLSDDIVSVRRARLACARAERLLSGPSREEETTYALDLCLIRGDAELYTNSGGSIIRAVAAYSEAMGILRNLPLQERGRREPRIRHSRSEAFLRNEDYESALEDASRAVELAPEDADLREQKGSVLYRMGRYQECLKEWSEAVKLSPYSAEHTVSLGFALFNVGSFEDALKEFRNVAEADSSNLAAWVGVMITHWRLGNKLEAVGRYGHICELEPRFKGGFEPGAESLGFVPPGERAAFRMVFRAWKIAAEKSR